MFSFISPHCLQVKLRFLLQTNIISKKLKILAYIIIYQEKNCQYLEKPLGAKSSRKAASEETPVAFCYKLLKFIKDNYILVIVIQQNEL